MPWAAAPPTDASVLEFLTPSVESFGGSAPANYAITRAGDGAYLGGCGLMSRVGEGALEIGYWVDVRHTRRGIGTDAARPLTAAALPLEGVERVEIHCDEANVASAAIPRRLGYRLDRIEADEPEAPLETGRSMIWVADRSRGRSRPDGPRHAREGRAGAQGRAPADRRGRRARGPARRAPLGRGFTDGYRGITLRGS
jgi:RimJ/RimL family protein N-acetyltransferase